MLIAGNAQAAQEVMNIAANDGRASLLILPLTAAIGWVGFNILQPALNQLDSMKLKKSIAAGVGLSAATLLAAQNADAAQQVADLAANDGRAGLLILPLTAAIGWVGFNILQPALNQLDSMKLKKSIAAGVGLSTATLLAAQNADAAQQVADLAANDGRAGLLLLPLAAAVAWVGFNILQPALNQFDSMKGKNSKKSIAAGVGLSAATLLAAQNADAAQQFADLAANDGRAGLLILPLTAALGWVGFNILQPALNQFDAMKSK